RDTFERNAAKAIGQLTPRAFCDDASSTSEPLLRTNDTNGCKNILPAHAVGELSSGPISLNKAAPLPAGTQGDRIHALNSVPIVPQSHYRAHSKQLNSPAPLAHRRRKW